MSGVSEQPTDQHDRAGKGYWDQVWTAADRPAPADGRSLSRIDRRFDALFRRVFADAPGGEVLEVGCAHSRWLPYFATDLGMRVAGLDYSELGCEVEREVLRRAGVSAEVRQADLFAPPQSFRDRFDVLFTLGVVEHFADTSDCLTALGAMLRPGGRLLTVIPNLTGVCGAIQKRFNRPVYDIHVPMGAPELAAAHRAAGLTVHESTYFLSTGFGILNLNGIDPRSCRGRAWTLRQLSRASKAVWTLEDRAGRPLPASRTLSPYVVCVAARPGVP